MNEMPLPSTVKPPIPEKALKVFQIAISILFAALLLALTVTSLFFTTEMNTDNFMRENLEYRKDSFSLNILFIIVPFGVFFGLKSVITKISSKTIKLALTIWVLLIGSIWVISVQSAPTFDSAYVTDAARSFSQNDYQALHGGHYFKFYPFQLGYVLYTETIIRIFRLTDNYILLQLINILCLAIAYIAILDAVELSTKKKSVCAFTAILLATCIQPVMFSTFLYGNLPGFMFSMLAVHRAIRFFKKRLKRDAFLSAFFIGLSVMLKLNSMIVLAALCIMILADFLKSKKLFDFVFLGTALLLGITLNLLAVKHYEWRADIKLPQGIPMVSWLAMGMNESYIGPGWYDGIYTEINYEATGWDASAAAGNSIDVIRVRLAELKEDPGYALNFFGRKFISQWNEPTYQSIWTNQVRGFYRDPVGIGKHVIGKGEPAAKAYAGFHQRFVFFFCFAGTVSMLKQKNFALLFFPLVIFGGFIYHMLFEAKSQYILIYYIMLIPVTAYGLDSAFQMLEDYIKKLEQRTK